MGIKRQMPSETEICDLADLFKVFGDSTRSKILIFLENKEASVGEISSELNMTISAISHQLRILKNAKLVKSKKEGKEVFYSLDDDHVTKIINCGLSHLSEKE